VKRTFAAALLAFVSCSAIGLSAQTVIQSGPWELFRQEQPPISYQEISTPFIVRKVSGTIVYNEGKPLKGASFQIGLRNGSVLGTDTDKDGRFELKSVRLFGPFVRSAALPSGTYRFKLTKDGFHSAVGTIVVSRKAPKESTINIALKPGDGYREEQPNPAPDEHLLPPSVAIPVVETHKHKKFPEKYAVIYAPVSLAVSQVRTVEFPVDKEWYDIMVQVEKPLPFEKMRCMMGVTAGPLDSTECSSNDPLLRADWTVWDGAKVVDKGSIPGRCACKFEDRYIYKFLGSFAGEVGKKYAVEVKFTKDGSPLDVAKPHLIVIQHRDN